MRWVDDYRRTLWVRKQIDRLGAVLVVKTTAKITALIVHADAISCVSRIIKQRVLLEARYITQTKMLQPREKDYTRTSVGYLLG